MPNHHLMVQGRRGKMYSIYSAHTLRTQGTVSLMPTPFYTPDADKCHASHRAHLLNDSYADLSAWLLQEALDSSRQEREGSDAEWDARHQEAVDSAEQWKAFADKLGKEKEEQQQQLATASADLQVLATVTRIQCALEHQHMCTYTVTVPMFRDPCMQLSWIALRQVLVIPPIVLMSGVVIFCVTGC